jgi:hypothetical protein
MSSFIAKDVIYFSYCETEIYRHIIVNNMVASAGVHKSQVPVSEDYILYSGA